VLEAKFAILIGALEGLGGVLAAKGAIFAGALEGLLGVGMALLAIWDGKFKALGLSPSEEAPAFESPTPPGDQVAPAAPAAPAGVRETDVTADTCSVELFSCNMELIVANALPEMLEQAVINMGESN
jgi:hypothetical protein